MSRYTKRGGVIYPARFKGEPPRTLWAALQRIVPAEEIEAASRLPDCEKPEYLAGVFLQIALAIDDRLLIH